MGLLTIERAIRRPHQVVKVGSPWFKQTREVFRPVLNRILKDCPGPLRPEHAGYTYTFQNPYWGERGESTITLCGVNTDRGDRLRGGDLDLGVLDECRDVKDQLYIQDDILMPMFLGREEPLLIYCTTIPKTLAHDYTVEILPAARREGRAKLFRVANLERDPLTPPDPEENLDWTDKHEHLVLKSISKSSSTWKREYLCLEVPDLTSLIIPEFPEVEGEVVYQGEDYTPAHRGRPEEYEVYMGADLGWEDFTACIWGFHDFEEDLLVIEAETVKNHTTPREIAKLIRETEQRLYPGHYSQRRIVRFADAEQITLAGLTLDERIPILPPAKWDRDEAIAKLRTRFSDRKVRIHARCKELIYQLKNGIWDDRRKDFTRSATLGHCDALSALIYLNRMGNWRKNPRLQEPRKPDTKFYPPWVAPPESSPRTVVRERTIRREPRRGGENPFR
jgi:hypothetical protein